MALIQLCGGRGLGPAPNWPHRGRAHDLASIQPCGEREHGLALWEEGYMAWLKAVQAEGRGHSLALQEKEGTVHPTFGQVEGREHCLAPCGRRYGLAQQRAWPHTGHWPSRNATRSQPGGLVGKGSCGPPQPHPTGLGILAVGDG